MSEKTSEKLKFIVCNPEGAVSIYGSQGDVEVMEEVLAELNALESALAEKDKIIEDSSKVLCFLHDLKTQQATEIARLRKALEEVYDEGDCVIMRRLIKKALEGK
jgi:hypothetical protein